MRNCIQYKCTDIRSSFPPFLAHDFEIIKFTTYNKAYPLSEATFFSILRKSYVEYANRVLFLCRLLL